jgi:hypothetical protein
MEREIFTQLDAEHQQRQIKKQYDELMASNRAASEMYAATMERAGALIAGLGAGIAQNEALERQIAALEQDGLKLEWHDTPLKDSEK